MSVALFRVKGLREIQRAARLAGPAAELAVTNALRKTGEGVRDEWERRFSRVDANSAAGYRVRVRNKGVAVAQSKRKKTGKHPEYGALQMRYGMRVALDMDKEIERNLEDAIGKIAEAF